jgi:sphinganine-1-phosphate aldolase
MQIPTSGLTEAQIQQTFDAYQAHDLKWRTGRVFAYTYDPGEEAERVAKQAYLRFLGENGLDPTVFPSLLQLENDVVSMIANHLGNEAAGGTVVGSFTSGGTESIILACKAAREAWREKVGQPHGRPEMVLPITAHAAFHKAAHYLGFDKVLVDVDHTTWRAIPAKVAEAIGPKTALIVGSSPGYAHGVIDPIAELAQLAVDEDVWLHVDACVGGFLLPYYRELGKDVPPFDFSLPGVRSLSVDLHKYGYAPKGASIVLYRNKDWRRYQHFACSQWTGYTVINPTVQSTKTGGPIAGAWAILNFLGKDGYLDFCRKMIEGMDHLVATIEDIDGFELCAQPDFSLLAATSTSFSIFHVIDLMKQRGWYIQPQLSYGPSPHNVHFSLHAGNAVKVPAMCEDLRACVEIARGMPIPDFREQVAALLAGAAEAGGFTDEMFGELLAFAGIDGVSLPEAMADINAMLDALPRDLSEQMLISFFNDLYVPR